MYVLINLQCCFDWDDPHLLDTARTELWRGEWQRRRVWQRGHPNEAKALCRMSSAHAPGAVVGAAQSAQFDRKCLGWQSLVVYPCASSMARDQMDA